MVFKVALQKLLSDSYIIFRQLQRICLCISNPSRPELSNIPFKKPYRLIVTATTTATSNKLQNRWQSSTVRELGMVEFPWCIFIYKVHVFNLNQTSCNATASTACTIRSTSANSTPNGPVKSAGQLRNGSSDRGDWDCSYWPNWSWESRDTARRETNCPSPGFLDPKASKNGL